MDLILFGPFGLLLYMAFGHPVASAVLIAAGFGLVIIGRIADLFDRFRVPGWVGMVIFFTWYMWLPLGVAGVHWLVG